MQRQTSAHVELPNVDLALQLFEVEQCVHALQIIVATQWLVAPENVGHMRLQRSHATAAAAAFRKVNQVFGQRMRGQRASGFIRGTAIARAAAATATIAALAQVDWQIRVRENVRANSEARHVRAHGLQRFD